jgi:hypothetical protein
MFATIPNLAFMNHPSTDLIFTGFLWFVIDVWRFFGPAEFAIAAIVASIIFAWVVTIPYLSWSLITYISKK